MRAASCTIPALLLAFAPCMAVKAEEKSTRFQFEGEVTRGQEYSHELPDGLTFYLRPSGEGWQISVESSQKLRDPPNLADITPPLHGPNATDIEGWHFRNADNSGPYKPSQDPDADSGAENEQDREFEFALSEPDHKSVWFDYNCASGVEKEDVCAQPHDVPKLLGYATLHIADYKLGNLVAGQRAWLEHMKFTVSGDYEAPRGIEE